MELAIGLYNKLEKPIYKARWTKSELDTSLRRSKGDEDSLLSHYRFCRKNPTTGMIIGQQYIWGQKITYHEAFRQNLEKFNNIPRVKKAKDAFEKRFDELYPNTGKARKLLIKKNHFDIDFVKPISKLSWHHTINFFKNLLK
ncbi:MAG: hypothetical protein LKG27_04425 [Clostridiaceae bacterium]|jgi:hypothetical protein|nr:hypothetical protein [Clostridiaceae bacterium]